MSSSNKLTPLQTYTRLGAAASLVALLSACGPGHVPDAPGAGGGSDQYAQQCSLSNPYRADSDSGASPATGSLSIEKQWAREYVDEAYLWYSKVPSVLPNQPQYSDESAAGFYPSIDSYFSDLTVNGLSEDRFSFTYPTKQWKDLSQSGISLGYGINFFFGSNTPPRVLRIAYVDPQSPAALSGVRRGDTVVSVDGVSVDDISTDGINVLNAALFPSTAGSHSFVFSRNGVNQAEVTLTASSVAMTPVPISRVLSSNGSNVGYMLFNDHVLTAESQLSDAITSFKTQGVTDLVLDMRYNGGGYLFLASQLAYMIAGDARTKDKTFERLQFNDKRVTDNDSANAITPFFNTLCLPDPTNFNCASSAALPVLNLARVWVLASSDTCSASEAVVNGLRGVDVQVNIIGGTTCGKPYGFTAKDNCGISYFPIEFQGVNAKGFGDYANGFSPTCQIADDFGHELGDTTEGMLAAALSHRNTGQCPTAGLAKSSAPIGRVLKGPERSNKFLLPGKGAKLR